MKNIAASRAGHVARSSLSRKLRKVEESSTFLATCNATFYCIASRENGVLYGQLSSQLAMQRLLRCKLQEKLPPVSWP